jgi:hypothetical protein
MGAKLRWEGREEMDRGTSDHGVEAESDEAGVIFARGPALRRVAGAEAEAADEF